MNPPKSKVCKCGHLKGQHKNFPLRHCNECPCSKFFLNSRPNKIDWLLQILIGLSLGGLFGSGIGLLQNIPEFHSVYAMAQLMVGFGVLVFTTGFLIYYIETALYPVISGALRKDYSKTL